MTTYTLPVSPGTAKFTREMLDFFGGPSPRKKPMRSISTEAKRYFAKRASRPPSEISQTAALYGKHWDAFAKGYKGSGAVGRRVPRIPFIKGSGIRSGTFPARRGGGKCGGNLCGGSLHVCVKQKGGRMLGYKDIYGNFVTPPPFYAMRNAVEASKKWYEEHPKSGGGTSRDLFYKRFTLPMRQGGAVRHRKRRSHRKRRRGGSFIA